MIRLHRTAVAVTGCGGVSRFGVGASVLTDGVAGDGASSPTAPVPPIEGFEVRDHVKLRTQCLDPVAGYALAAAAEALEESGWGVPCEEPDATGLLLGSAYGNAATLEEYTALSAPSPLRFVHSFINAPAGLTSQVLKLRGPHGALCSGPLAGMQAIRYGVDLLARGAARRLLCGGADSCRRAAVGAFGRGRAGEGGALVALEGGGAAPAVLTGVASAVRRDDPAAALDGVLEALEVNGERLVAGHADGLALPAGSRRVSDRVGEAAAAAGPMALVAAVERVRRGEPRMVALEVDRGEVIAVVVERRENRDG